MANVLQGSTAICSLTVTDSTGALVDPATSLKITIKPIGGAVIIDGVDMVKDSTGKYHYDFATANRPVGFYEVTYVAVDNARIASMKDVFSIV